MERFKEMSRFWKATIVFIVFIVVVASVSAAYWIYSNPVPVSSSAYTLGTLIVDNDAPIQYEIITFSGDLTLDGAPVEGATIILFRDDIQIDGTTTDVNGEYVFLYNMTDVGSFTFKTGYEVS